MLNYLYKKYKDVHTIQNLAGNSITYRISRVECDSNEVIKSGTIDGNSTFILPFKYQDGTYSVILSDGVSEETLTNIVTYSNLLLTVIDNIDDSLCGCIKCKGCKDCDTCENYMKMMNSVLAYYYVNSPKYNSYSDLVINNIKCNFTENVICSVNQDINTGEQDVTEILKRIIASYYLGFYFTDLYGAADVSEADYIKAKYKSSKIIKCIKKLGINIDDITDFITINMNVYYWQLQQGETFEDLEELFSLNTLVGKPSKPFSEYEQGTKTIYTIEGGRPVFVIRETVVQNFEINDSLGNDITDEFDYQYYPDIKTVLFVDKEPVSYGQPFAKFKKMTYEG